jgi:rhodanese-related sulfurtransferase
VFPRSQPTGTEPDDEKEEIMNLITRDDLRAKLDRGDEFKLVMTLSEFAYRAKHIPTSLHFETIKETLGALNPAEEIVVYCADVHCSASIYAYYLLERAGYARVRRYAGGIADWEAAGYRFEHGTPVAKTDRSGIEQVPPRTATDGSGTSFRRSRPCSRSS